MENLDYVLVALIALLCVFAGALAFSTTTVVDKEIVVNNTIIEIVEVQVADNTTLDIRNKLFEEEDFEVLALELAMEDLENKGYKDLFNAMVGNGTSIEEKEDISKVIVRDSDVYGIDVDDQDAEVELELKIYFEDLNGSDVKIYVAATYTIVDGEVDNVVYTF